MDRRTTYEEGFTLMNSPVPVSEPGDCCLFKRLLLAFFPSQLIGLDFCIFLDCMLPIDLVFLLLLFFVAVFLSLVLALAFVLCRECID